MLSLKHLNDNHHNVRFCCAEALKSLIQKRELFHVEIENEPPDQIIEIDWMRESWWKRNDAQKQLQEWWQRNGSVVSVLQTEIRTGPTTSIGDTSKRNVI